MDTYKDFYSQFFLHKYSTDIYLKYNPKGFDVLPYEYKSITAVNPASSRHSVVNQTAATGKIKENEN